MTKKEYLELKIGDKIEIKTWPDKGRIVKIGDISNSPWFKFNSAGKDGFMVGNIWYPYQVCKKVSNITLYDYCKGQLKKNPDIKDFWYKNIKYRKNELDKLKTISGKFESEIYEDEYIDYDGRDDEGKPIYIRFRWLVCKIKKVGE